MSTDVQALINYYAREGYHKHVQTVCNEVLKKKGTEPVLLFWKAYGTLMEGGVAEALKEYDSLQSRREIALAVYSALIHAHKLCKLVDHDAIKECTAKLQAEERVAPEKAFLQAATFFWHIKNYDKAKDYVNMALTQSPNNPQSLALRGWIGLMSTKSELEKDQSDKSGQALADFDKAVAEKGQKRELEAILGKAKCFELRGQYPQALEQLNQIIVSFAWFLPALTEKAKILMMMGDWEQALETAQRVLSQDNYNIEALRLTVLYLLTRESRHAVATNRISDLIESMDRHEPKNHQLYFNISRPFARLSARNPQVLERTLLLVDRARKLMPENAQYVTEYAIQQTLQGDYAGAMKSFRQATKLDETSAIALFGMIKCQILEGNLEDAAHQLEFLSEIQLTIGKAADLAFLTALLAWRKDQDMNLAIRSLDEAVKLHVSSVHGLSTSFEYFVQLNPDFLLEIAKEYLQHVGNEPLDPSESQSPVILKGIAVLETLVRQVPGLLEAQLLLAKARFISNDLDAAQRTLATCLKLDPTYSDAHILVAQIFLMQERFKQASQALEQALSHNFEVREWPVYHLVKAKTLESSGDLEDALKVLEAAMLLPGMKSSKSAAGGYSRGGGTKAVRKELSISLHDKASIYLCLVQVHRKLNHLHEATKYIQDAIHEFRGTPEEVRITIANCELALQRGDVENALALLRVVPPDNSNYSKARMVMAQIYLQYRNDQRQYARCYMDLAEKNPNQHTQVLLAEAYLKIQEPEEAIKAYKVALEKNPSDSNVALKIGKALVQTHDYARAIRYYEDAVRNDAAKMPLRYHLAELYLKLGKHEQAEKVITDAVQGKKDMDDVEAMVIDVKNLSLLAQVHKGAGNVPKAMEALEKARLIQNGILSRSRSEQPELLRTQRSVAANICHNLAEYHAEQKNMDKALSFYNEALKHDDAHEKSMLALAKLHLSRGEIEACQLQCVTLLRLDPTNEEASMMLADLMFRKNEFDAAIYHFQQLLEKKPTHYLALSRLIQLLRRAGRLQETQRLLKAAERSSPRAALHPGLHFCKGVYNRYTNNPHEALRELNMARKDSEWGERALMQMIEIYLNPDNETLLEEAGGSQDGMKDNMEYVRAVEKLLKELQGKSKGIKYMVLECYAMMATKAKNQIETALNKFIDLLNVERDHVPALLGMAAAFMMLKQTPKARNHLKRISKMPYNPDEADEFERAWLMLADIYIEGGKMDLAQELCKKALSYNKSCARAWEYLGLVMEKEQSYRDASDNYENAWKFDSESNPTVGFKLAFNYLKAKRFVEAVDICHKVLSLDPNYPKIRKDILEKARASIRP